MPDEDLKRYLRNACGFTDPVQPVEQIQAPPSYTEEASKRALEVWDYMLAQSGTMPNVLDGKE